MTSPISLTVYAKRRGVSVKAVSKAVSSGRIVESVVRDQRGQPKIGDPDLADREWDANTRPRIDHPPPASRSPRVPPPPLPQPPLPQPQRPPPPRDLVPEYNESRALREAHAARREAAMADLAELDVGERKGELVPVAEARAEVVDRYTIVKTKLLGVPARVAQRLPHLAAEIVPVVDELLREALEELADDGGDE